MPVARRVSQSRKGPQVWPAAAAGLAGCPFACHVSTIKEPRPGHDGCHTTSPATFPRSVNRDRPFGLVGRPGSSDRQRFRGAPAVTRGAERTPGGDGVRPRVGGVVHVRPRVVAVARGRRQLRLEPPPFTHRRKSWRSVAPGGSWARRIVGAAIRGPPALVAVRPTARGPHRAEVGQQPTWLRRAAAHMAAHSSSALAAGPPPSRRGRAPKRASSRAPGRAPK